MTNSKTFTAFAGMTRLHKGSLAEVAVAVAASDSTDPLLTFDDETGRVVDLDLRGTSEDIQARYAEPAKPARGRGRPKLGVVPREVTLLPRHWDWLSQQPGGASQALRRLIDDARRADEGATDTRRTQEITYRFLSAMAGNLPGFEEASRALFSGQSAAFEAHSANWPVDVRTYASTLLAGATDASSR
ncbi:MAG: DUF2239 family protein [Thalassovita sp.]